MQSSRISTLGYSGFKNPNIIYVSEKIGGKAKPISPEKFASKHGFIWTEANVVETEHAEEFRDLTRTDQMPNWMLDAIIEQINEYNSSLTICYMNEQVGYGVFASKNIPENVYIATYTGLLQPSADKGIYPYGVGIDNPTTGKRLGILDAVLYRNIGAFFQHVPEQSSDYTLKDNKNMSFATQNINILSFAYQGYPVLLYKTTREINKGEELGWDYGVQYWMNSSSIPSLFTPQGETLPSTSYCATKLTVVLETEKGRLTIEEPLADLERLFLVNDGLLKIQAEPHEILAVTQDDFMQEYNKNPHSPYVVLKPSMIIPCGPQSKPEPTVEKENTPTSPGFSFRLQGQSESKAICEELSRITEALSLPKWGYSQKNRTAFLRSSPSDETALRALHDYLASQKIKTRFGKDQNTKEPLLYVIQPKVQELKQIMAFKTLAQTCGLT